MLISLTVKVVFTVLENHGNEYTSSIGFVHTVWSNVVCRDERSESLFLKQQKKVICNYLSFTILRNRHCQNCLEQSGFF